MATYSANFSSQGAINLPELTRGQIEQESLAVYPIPWESWRVHDAYSTLLPATSASDDLGLYAGTFGTNTPSIRTFDVKNTTSTLYARTTLILPVEYDAGETVQLRFYAGMLTTVASSSATIDAQLYESDSAAGVSADLVTTSAQSINSLMPAYKTFTVTPDNLVAGDMLDLRVTIAVVDSATATAVIGFFGAAALLLDIRG